MSITPALDNLWEYINSPDDHPCAPTINKAGYIDVCLRRDKFFDHHLCIWHSCISPSPFKIHSYDRFRQVQCVLGELMYKTYTWEQLDRTDNPSHEAYNMDPFEKSTVSKGPIELIPKVTGKLPVGEYFELYAGGQVQFFTPDTVAVLAHGSSKSYFLQPRTYLPVGQEPREWRTGLHPSGVRLIVKHICSKLIESKGEWWNERDNQDIGDDPSGEGFWRCAPGD